MKGRVASCVLPWVNFSVLPVTLQMQCLFFLSTTYRSHRLPIEHRNRENDSRCCLCICLTTLPKCLWEGGGGWGLHWVNPTTVREPLLLSPLNHLVPVSSFWMSVSGMCIWAHASWNLAFEISRTWFLYLKPFCLTLPGPLCPALLPVALGASLHCCPTPPSPSLPVSRWSVYSDYAEKEAEVMKVHLWHLHAEVSWFSATSALKPAEHLMHSAFSFSSRKQNKQQYKSDYGNSMVFTLN